MYRLAKLHSGE